MRYADFFKMWDRLDDSERRRRCEHLQAKYPAHVPVIVASGRHGIQLEKWRFIIGKDKTVRDLLAHVRYHNPVSLYPAMGVMLLASNTLVHCSANMNAVYEEFQDETDSFLYMTLLEEHHFGSSSSSSCNAPPTR